MMRYLCRLYQDLLRNLDASEEIINNLNVARLKRINSKRGTRTVRAEEWKIMGNYIINIRQKCQKSIG